MPFGWMPAARRTPRPPPGDYPTAHALAAALEARWFRLTLTADGRLRVTPAAWLWPEDRTAIAEHRDGLVALVRDTAEPVDVGLRFVRFDPRRAVGGSGAGAETTPRDSSGNSWRLV